VLTQNTVTESESVIYPDALDTLQSVSGTPSPSVSARSAIVVEAETGRVIWAKNAHVSLPMASTTKIMTALVALENADPEKTVSIPPDAVGVEGSSVYLYEDERLRLEDLLYAMLLESANDAAAAIAIEVGGSIEGFSEMMNAKAEELGLERTSFANPHGLDDPEHYTTAAELARIAVAAMKNESFCNIVSTYKKTIPLNETEGVRLLINHNKMLSRYDGAVGIKTGYTKKSGRCLVSAAERDHVKLICVTLNAPDD
jgi:D-alanyl-D-alanine carboxypeptidase